MKLFRKMIEQLNGRKVNKRLWLNAQIFCSYYQPGVTSEFTASTTNPVESIGICKLSKTNMLIRSELHEDDVTKPIHDKRAVAIGREPEKRKIDW